MTTRPHAWWRLWGLQSDRAEVCATAAVLLVMAVSRFALLPSGPWEWDETLFARGILDFELAAHFPHPPGFPLWLAIGWVLTPFAGEPLVALQWASSIASVVAVWPLALLGRQVAPQPVATLAAVLVSMLPGPWLFAVRGFSSTAATVLVLAAAALWSHVGLRRRGAATVFTVVLTAAFLVRPILLPVIGLAWLAGAATVRPLRNLLPGVLAGFAMVAISAARMAWLEGGWEAFVRPFVVHFGRHTARLHLNTGGFGDLGLVKGVGGSAVALVAAVLIAVGLVQWARRVGWRSAAVWAVLLTALVGQLLTLQNRSYPRYAVAAQLAAAPLVAGAVALAPAPAAIALLVAGTAGAAWTAWPLLEEQHRLELPAWSAAVEAERVARGRDWAVVVEPEVHPFASYWWHVLERRGVEPPPLILSPRAPEDWGGVDRPWVVATVHRHLYLDGLTGREQSLGGVSHRLTELTQHRFLEAAVIENPPLPVGRWWSREEAGDGRLFMWAGAAAELWLPPLPEGSRLRIRCRIRPGPEPVRIRSDGAFVAELAGHPERAEILDLFRRRDDGPWIIGFCRSEGYPPGGGDPRPLSVAVDNPWFRPPGTSFRVDLTSPEERARDGLELEGAYPLEQFGRHGAGHWLGPEAAVAVDVPGHGAVVLDLAAPRPTPPESVVSAAPGLSIGPLDFTTGPRQVAVRFDEARAGTRIEVVSVPFSPAEAGLSDDRRVLGVALTGVSWWPAGVHPEGWWSDPLDETGSEAAR